MKKKIILSTLFVITLMLIIVILFQNVLATKVIEESFANTEVLKEVERKIVNPDEPLEEVIGEEVLEKKILLNDISKKALSLYNIEYQNIQNTNNVQIIEDNLLDRTVRRLELSNAQIDIDKNGNIVKLINKEDFSTQDKNRRNYQENKKIEEISYPIKTREQIQNIINEVISTYNLQTYEIVECHNDLIGTWTVVWNNVLPNEIINPYDVVVVNIDAKDGSIMMFSRNIVTPTSTNILISKDEAISKAKTVINYNDENISVDSELTTFRPNFYWENNTKFYQEADFIRVAWKIVINDGIIVMIDAETGESLGGSQEKSDGARAMTLVPTFYKASEATIFADRGLKKLGYSEPVGCQPHCGWVEKIDVEWVIHHKELYGLYISCHGDVDENGNFRNAITDMNNWTLNASEVTGNWHFVFLDACKTATTDAFPKAFKTYGYEGRAFIGWNVEVYETTAYYFVQSFYSKVGSMTLHQAVLSAASEVIAAGHTDCNAGFYGDLNYYGWAW